MRSAWPKTFGATMWPSICCSAVNMIAEPQRVERLG